MSNGSKMSSLGVQQIHYFKKTRTFDIKHLKEYLKSIKEKLAYLCQNKYQMGVTDIQDIKSSQMLGKALY